MTKSPPRGIYLYRAGDRNFTRWEAKLAPPGQTLPVGTVIALYDQRSHVMRWIMLLIMGLFLCLTVALFLIPWEIASVTPARVAIATALAAALALYAFIYMSTNRLFIAFQADWLIIRKPRLAGLGMRTIPLQRETIEDVLLQRSTTPVGPSYKLSLKRTSAFPLLLIRHERNKAKIAWFEQFIAAWIG